MRNELFIGYDSDNMYSLDTIEGLDINITKNIYSIENPSIRLSDFTKTVSIPGSKKNDAIFSSLFDVNMHIQDAQQLNPDFNPAKKADCIYMQDELVQIEGYCQLVSITVLNDNKVTYDIVIYGMNADLLSKMGNKTLNDIEGFGTFVWNDTTIKNSWAAPTDPIFFPYVDRGKAFSWRQGVSVGNASVDYNCFKPWINAYYTFLLILNDIGIGGSQIDSDFLNSEVFQRVIYECDLRKFVLDEAAKDNSKAEGVLNVNHNITLTLLGLAGIWAAQNWVLNVVVQDNLSQFTTAADGEITVVNEGYHTFKANYSFLVDGAGFTGKECGTYLILLRGGVYTLLASDVQFDNNAFVVGSINVNSYYFQVGDQIRMCAGYAKFAGAYVLGTTFEFNTLSSAGDLTELFYEDSQYTYGSTISIASILPNMKQTDFIMGIVKMFNLYIEPQPDGTYLIEPRDDFFLDDTIDWTDKLDTSRDFVIRPEGLLTVKEINFNYAQGEDDISKVFYQSVGKTFGHRWEIFDNDFVKDIKNLDLPFTCEPLQWQKEQEIICIKTNYDGAAQERTAKPIIAFAGAAPLDCLNYAYFDAGAMTFTNYSSFPYAGFLDDPYTPAHDLCFNRQEIYFHTTRTGLHLTNQNLYNKYHKNQWDQIGDRDSKLVECYMKLNANDINQLSFRKIYWIRDAAYRLLEVQDYAPNGETTTLCKFLKLNLVDELTPETTDELGNDQNGDNQGGGGHTGGGGGGDQMGLNVALNGIWNGGYDNIVGQGSKGIVTGTGNSIGANVLNFKVAGHNNTILPGLSNVTLINCTGLEITESDVTYMDGVYVPRHYISETPPVTPAPRVGDVWYKITP